MLADASCVANRSRCVSNSHKVFSQLLCGYFKYVKSFRFSQFEAPVYGCACVRKSAKFINCQEVICLVFYRSPYLCFRGRVDAGWHKVTGGGGLVIQQATSERCLTLSGTSAFLFCTYLHV